MPLTDGRWLQEDVMDEPLSRYLPAIEMMMCHLGRSFEEACLELGLEPRECHRLRQEQASGQDGSRA